jgi:hypothetical protein
MYKKGKNMKTPEVGTIINSSELQKKYGINTYNNYVKLIYVKFPCCGKNGWRRFVDKDKKCRTCEGKNRRRNDVPLDATILTYGEYRKLFPDAKVLKNKRAYIHATCPQCQKPRWVPLPDYNKDRICRPCNLLNNKSNMLGTQNHKWNPNIRIKNSSGYIEIRIPENSPYISMTRKSGKRKFMVLEHRLVMAKHTGRCLFRHEIVHHKNSIKDDNRIENLELISSQGKHMLRSHVPVSVASYIQQLEEKIIQLSSEVE